MKRKAEGEAEAFSRPKKSRIESAAALTCLAFEDPDYELEADDSLSERASQLSQSADTLASTQPASTPLTPLSPARKFPSDLKTIKCTYPGCDKAYNRPARLAAHMRSHANDRPYKCTYPDCDKTYIEEKHLKQHIKGSHTAERSYACAVTGCGKSFLTATRLRRHQAVHEGQERFRCRDFPPCNQSFRKHQTLQRHIRSEHLQVAAYPCTHSDPETGAACGAGFDSAAALKRHEEREHGELRFWCDECTRQKDEHGNPKRTGFPTAWLLQSHIKQVHANCMFCGLSCNGRADLDKHIEEHHSNQGLEQRKNVPCTWPGCNKTFTKKSNLNTHIRVAHEGVRFVCGAVDLSGTDDLVSWPQSEGCGEGFSTKAALENHVRYVHLKYARPQSDITTSQSEQQYVLKLLEGLTGVGEKSRRTVPCTISGCTLKFVNASELDAHMRSQHSIEQALITNVGEEPMSSGTTLGSYSEHQHGFSKELQEILNRNENGLRDGEPASGEEVFWYGADAAPSQTTFDEEWHHDEAEMRHLIGVGDDALEDLIDPALH
ncbi:hypothetical protein DL771_010431 [Monosporascus sp. 5C6A]|nr:hypothetical protein DL771_010431 [Monosporascus sp. 5C6A]